VAPIASGEQISNPSRNLDEATGEGIHQLLVELNQRLGIAAIVVTHNPRLAERMRAG